MWPSQYNPRLELERIQEIHRELGIPLTYAEQTGLLLQHTPLDLVDIGLDIEGRPRQLSKPAATAWTRMHERAKQDEVCLQVVSAYRSLNYQVELIRMKLAQGESIDQILLAVAAPGYSEHQSGCALDLTCPEAEPLDEAFESTRAFRWLEAKAKEEGFRMSYPRGNPYGVIYEPWHWCYVR